MTLDEKASKYATDIVLYGKASIDSVEEAYKAGYSQAQEDISLSDMLVRREELDAEIQRSLRLAYEIAQLKSQIKKMKSCHNCRHYSYGSKRCLIEEDCDEQYSEWELE